MQGTQKPWAPSLAQPSTGSSPRWRTTLTSGRRRRGRQALAPGCGGCLLLEGLERHNHFLRLCLCRRSRPQHHAARGAGPGPALRPAADGGGAHRRARLRWADTARRRPTGATESPACKRDGAGRVPPCAAGGGNTSSIADPCAPRPLPPSTGARSPCTRRQEYVREGAGAAWMDGAGPGGWWHPATYGHMHSSLFARRQCDGSGGRAVWSQPRRKPSALQPLASADGDAGWYFLGGGRPSGPSHNNNPAAFVGVRVQEASGPGGGPDRPFWDALSRGESVVIDR